MCIWKYLPVNKKVLYYIIRNLEHPVVKIVLLNNCAIKILKWSVLSSWSHKFSTGYCSMLGTFCDCLYLAEI